MAIIKTTQAPSSPGLSLRHSTGGINARVSHRMPNGGVSIRVVVMEFPMPITDITNTHSSEKSLLERQVEAIKKLERQVEAIKKIADANAPVLIIRTSFSTLLEYHDFRKALESGILEYTSKLEIENAVSLLQQVALLFSVNITSFDTCYSAWLEKLEERMREEALGAMKEENDITQAHIEEFFIAWNKALGRS